MRNTYWTAHIVLFAFLLLGLSSLNGMVLCIEKDGSVSLESAIGGICSDAFQDIQRLQPPSPVKTSIQAAHCKRCVDVPISIVSNEHQGQALEPFQGLAQTPLLVEAPVVSVGYLSTATESQMPQPPPLRPIVHQFLKTVILLI